MQNMTSNRTLATYIELEAEREGEQNDDVRVVTRRVSMLPPSSLVT